MPQPPMKGAQDKGGARCPTCGSELTKSPLGDAIMRQVAKQAAVKQRMGQQVMQRGQMQRPAMLQQAQQMPRRPM